MIKANDFVRTFNPSDNGIDVQFAMIDPGYSEGKPKLIFDGEIDVTQKGYPFLSSFKPKGGERIVLLNGVIIGSVEEPGGSAEPPPVTRTGTLESFNADMTVTVVSSDGSINCPYIMGDSLIIGSKVLILDGIVLGALSK